MKCTKCQSDLTCRVSIRTEEIDRPIEISYQWWYCKNCRAKYYATLEDSHVDMFDDRLRHSGYAARDPLKWIETLLWATKCPDQSNECCTCEVHENIHPSDFYGEFAWYTY